MKDLLLIYYEHRQKWLQDSELETTDIVIKVLILLVYYNIILELHYIIILYII